MKKGERQHLEKRLREERERALKALRQAEQEERAPPRESAGDVSLHSFQLAEEGAHTEEQEKDFLVVEMQSELLARIDEALELLYRDPARFERCERCDGQIEMERFEVIPWTRLCALCSRAAEGAGRGGV